MASKCGKTEPPQVDSATIAARRRFFHAGYAWSVRQIVGQRSLAGGNRRSVDDARAVGDTAWRAKAGFVLSVFQKQPRARRLAMATTAVDESDGKTQARGGAGSGVPGTGCDVGAAGASGVGVFGRPGSAPLESARRVLRAAYGKGGTAPGGLGGELHEVGRVAARTVGRFATGSSRVGWAGLGDGGWRNALRGARSIRSRGRGGRFDEALGRLPVCLIYPQLMHRSPSGCAAIHQPQHLGMACAPVVHGCPKDFHSFDHRAGRLSEWRTRWVERGSGREKLVAMYSISSYVAFVLLMHT